MVMGCVVSGRDRCEVLGTDMCKVTPWSLKSCTLSEVAITSCATLSMMSTFHVGIAPVATADDAGPDPLAVEAEGGALSWRSVVSAPTWWSRRVLPLINPASTSSKERKDLAWWGGVGWEVERGRFEVDFGWLLVYDGAGA